MWFGSSKDGIHQFPLFLNNIKSFSIITAKKILLSSVASEVKQPYFSLQSTNLLPIFSIKLLINILMLGALVSELSINLSLLWE